MPRSLKRTGCDSPRGADQQERICLGFPESVFSSLRAMEITIDPEKQVLIDSIQRRIAYLLATKEYTVEDKEAIARRFFQALEGGAE